MPVDMTSEPSGWGVYMLCCADDTLYTGITNRMAHRLRMHQAGKASRYTRGRLPVQWLYWEAAADKSAALKRELVIKALPRPAKWALIDPAGSPLIKLFIATPDVPAPPW